MGLLNKAYKLPHRKRDTLEQALETWYISLMLGRVYIRLFPAHEGAGNVPATKLVTC